MDKFAIVRSSHRAANEVSMKTPRYRRYFLNWLDSRLRDDIGRGGDISTDLVIPVRHVSNAIVKANCAGTAAGFEEMRYFFKSGSIFSRQLTASGFFTDAQQFRKGDVLLRLSGNTRKILQLERSLLNFLQRMCGIATLTAHYVRNVPKTVLICPTRKVLLGDLDKKACLVGGGGTHRLRLDDAVLLKDNHLKATGGNVLELLARVSEQGKKLKAESLRFIEIEVDSAAGIVKIAQKLEELSAANLRLPPLFILFDNMKPREISHAIRQIRDAGYGSRLFFEASGGVTAKNIREYGVTGVDVISVGSLTNSVEAIDLTLELV
ncbi:MAG TPA: carboxylating nicotinate-nucleotide diphosphorylase [Candidatus Gracilibacteria bacterium]|nr:carboxylating nicotinate-nucleotide diphosphorylase [Candidatus Gracilibacteria bacterium]